jgi:hypothetical protein
MRVFILWISVFFHTAWLKKKTMYVRAYIGVNVGFLEMPSINPTPYFLRVFNSVGWIFVLSGF